MFYRPKRKTELTPSQNGNDSRFMSFLLRENATCSAYADYHKNIYTRLPSAVKRCAPHFDKSLCWYNVSAGSTGYRDCPFQFCTSIPGCDRIASEYKVSRVCQPSGVWNDSVYSQCIEVLERHRRCVAGYCQTCPDPLRETVINVSLTLSVISVALLVAALVLFSIFDSIQCRRLQIHKNLALAFVFRFAVLAIWTVLNSSNAFHDCNQYVPQPIKSLEWLCKMVIWLVIYFQVASVMWMLIEGIYLYSRFTVFAMRYGDAPYAVFLLTGWGIPFVVVMIWTFIHSSITSKIPHSYCWLPYAQGRHLWILGGTMGAALLLNLVVLLAIIGILVQKLRTESAAESKKIWRAVKATILLVPLLGVSNIPLFYEPNTPGAIYMLGSAILQHSQGIFIAVLYCFLNAEIQGAIKRQLAKMPFSFNKLNSRFTQRVRFETERTYVPTNEANGQRLPLGEMRNGSVGQGTVTSNGTTGTQNSSSMQPLLCNEGTERQMQCVLKNEIADDESKPPGLREETRPVQF
ncbi:unnamed protein product [Bursaphelenchus xylophilus]|uniref:(pine wood nematode) hypothetical protein n=1 Tax=Bursaphelenchus xylophilus TaxID=6326 RepID=A0A1I7SQU3_BURXY|nr:unnamed protein product [Bursaphelenchus xylophilus]CAG9110392.1 unnamed protein product [Bursaphelenchus xylophilus]